MKNKGLRTILLVFLLSAPALFYLFLQLFGDNHYQVPVLYDQGVKENIEGCFFSDKQHFVSEFNLYNHEGGMTDEAIFADKLTIVDFFSIPCRENSKLLSAMKNLETVFKDYPVQIVSISTDTAFYRDSSVSFDERLFLFGEKELVYRLARCSFVLPLKKEDFCEEATLVLVDDQKRIRGYYETADKEELERLTDEIKILLKYEYKE